MSDLSGNSIDKFVDKYGNALKPKMERVKEAVSILSKMKELGIPTNEPGYTMTKQLLDTWIQGAGETWSGRVDFPRFGRRAELVLPVKFGKYASMKLFAPNT
jgi:hypothetical protein